MTPFLPISMEDYVKSGEAVRVLPNTDSGHRSYGAGRLFKTNHLPNPSFETTSGTPGIAEGCSFVDGVGTAVTTLPAGRNTGQSQRFQYTGVAGDSALSCYVILPATAVGSFASGDESTFSIYVKGTKSAGVTVIPVIQYFTAAAGYITQRSGGGISLTSSFVSTTYTPAVAPATTSYLVCQLVATNINEGDSIDLTIDDGLVEKAATASDYYETSSLVFTDIVTINESGVTAAGTNVAYSRNSSGAYYGPVVVGASAYSAGEQTILAANWSDPVALFRYVKVGDYLLPLNGDSVAYKRVV